MQVIYKQNPLAAFANMVGSFGQGVGQQQEFKKRHEEKQQELAAEEQDRKLRFEQFKLALQQHNISNAHTRFQVANQSGMPGVAGPALNDFLKSMGQDPNVNVPPILPSQPDPNYYQNFAANADMAPSLANMPANPFAGPDFGNYASKPPMQLPDQWMGLGPTMQPGQPGPTEANLQSPDLGLGSITTQGDLYGQQMRKDQDLKDAYRQEQMNNLKSIQTAREGMGQVRDEKAQQTIRMTQLRTAIQMGDYETVNKIMGEMGRSPIDVSNAITPKQKLDERGYTQSLNTIDGLAKTGWDSAFSQVKSFANQYVAPPGEKDKWVKLDAKLLSPNQMPYYVPKELSQTVLLAKDQFDFMKAVKAVGKSSRMGNNRLPDDLVQNSSKLLAINYPDWHADFEKNPNTFRKKLVELFNNGTLEDIPENVSAEPTMMNPSASPGIKFKVYASTEQEAQDFIKKGYKASEIGWKE